jgi:hypothetical protein
MAGTEFLVAACNYFLVAISVFDYGISGNETMQRKESVCFRLSDITGRK